MGIYTVSMARSYYKKRIHVYISEELNEMIQEHLSEGETRSAFLQKCVVEYLEKNKLSAPVSKLEHEHIIKYYFNKYFGKPQN